MLFISDIEFDGAEEKCSHFGEIYVGINYDLDLGDWLFLETQKNSILLSWSFILSVDVPKMQICNKLAGPIDNFYHA